MRVKLKLIVEINDENKDDIWMNIDDDVMSAVREALEEALIDHDYNFNSNIITEVGHENS